MPANIADLLRAAAEFASQFQQAQQQAPPPPPRGKPKDKIKIARDVLGFEPEVVLTAELVKDRRKKLAEVLHPDKGGSKTAMQRVNMAADALLESLK